MFQDKIRDDLAKIRQSSGGTLSAFCQEAAGKCRFMASRITRYPELSWPLPTPGSIPPMQTLQFQLTDDFIELHKLLKTTGIVGSGGEGKALVSEGQVRVNGAVELRKACKIRAGQVVETGDARITVLAPE